MPPVRIVVPGDYWDSQIYSGRLYLFRMDGALMALDWDRVVNTIEVPDDLRLALTCAFSRSDYLYGNHWSLLFSDPEVRFLLTEKFRKLSERCLELPSKLASAILQDNPFPFPHADSLVYKKSMYVVGQDGLFKTGCNKRTKGPVSRRVERLVDCPGCAISASWNTVALAAGSEGLFEVPFDYHLYSVEPRRYIEQHCSSCDWVFHSVFASSHLHSGVLASFRKEGADLSDSSRVFDRALPAEEIFRVAGFSWGTQDKLCLTNNGTVHVAKYQPWEKDPEAQLHLLGTLPIDARGPVVTGRVAYFGTILETESGLAVIRSDGGTEVLAGEPVNWRVFPRSKHYENHLHVIYEDRLEILSFNHDYFLEQQSKISGIEVMRSASWRR